MQHSRGACPCARRLRASFGVTTKSYSCDGAGTARARAGEPGRPVRAPYAPLKPQRSKVYAANACVGFAGARTGCRLH